MKLPLIALPLLALAGPATAGEDLSTPDPRAFETSVKPFFAKTCYLCHNARLKSGGLDLEFYSTPEAIGKDPHTWETVALKVRTGEMPPKGLPRPSDADRTAISKWIAEELERADLSAPPNPGRVTARRLNRTEYNNTVRDLLAVLVRPADDFPQDDSGYGFDNIGDVLSLSPVLMERYLGAAEKVAQAALLGPAEMKPSLVKVQPRNGQVVESAVVPADYDREGLSLANSLHARHRIPVEADYKIRVVFGGSRPGGSEPLSVALWVDDEKPRVLEFDPDEQGKASFTEGRQELTGKSREFQVHLTAGEHRLAASILHMYEGLPASYNGPNASTRPEPPPREFKPPADLTPEKLEAFKKRFEARRNTKAPANDARVGRLDIVGPFDAAKGPSPESQKRVYVCGHLKGAHAPGCARAIVTSLAHRAYRRPVTARDVDPLVRLYSSARRRGEPFEQALSLAFQAILVSPDFLFRIEKDRPETDAPGQAVSDHELASRLSYFLWASMPDDELLRVADEGALRQPAVLVRQVRRMLQDEKTDALVDAFGGQWLQVRALESASPDRDRFPGFDNNLRLSMRRETELFFESIVREDKSILDFIEGKYSFLNERLARHYGIAGVKGPQFRQVDLGGTARGGVLTQGSVLTVSSYPTRTSTVLRGKWVLENILGAPPPDPPAGTPRLDESKVSTDASLRKQMEAHRTNQTCASCHARMDPIGFGLENFDAIGAWRTEDGKFPIDPSGVMPDGRTFDGPAGLKTVLSGDRDAFAECLAEKLLTYALGRGLERYDKRTVKAIAGRLAASDYRFSALVLEIVNSLPFQMRRGDRGRS